MPAPEKDPFAGLKAQALRHAGMILFPPNAALEFIQLCDERDIKLLGFDGFRMLPNDKVQPCLEHSLDLSDRWHTHLSSEERISAAKEFVQQRTGTDIVFEMVTDPDV